MTITFSKISSIFFDFIKNPKMNSTYDDEIQKLTYLIIKTNKTLWDLEDSARLSELGDKHVAEVKKNIDIHNQQRNDLIREIDTVLYSLLDVSKGSESSFYSESPGMLIDRLSIIFIKSSVVQKMISVIEEDDLRLEYLEKEKILLGQIESISNFLDFYIERLLKKDVFFEIQQPVKIYNDARVRKYIKHFDN
ncbi:DUF4254 domain-containing protein [Patescibacteria group bacterium]|nr:DUF4254 domain-containing protein [Patescibacteria group bacterium]